MKKIILSLLIFSLIRFDIYGESYTIPLTYQVSPAYTVVIPKVVDISRNETSFTFSVSGDIYYDYCLKVVFNNSATITNEKTSSLVNVTQNKSTFNYEDLLSSTSETVYLNHQTLKAGSWSGVLNLMITLEEGA